MLNEYQINELLMSTPGYWEGQENVVADFQTTLEHWFNGDVSWDEVEEELQRLLEDDDVHQRTYAKCCNMWDEAQTRDEFWQEEERQKWRDLDKDQGAY